MRSITITHIAETIQGGVATIMSELATSQCNESHVELLVPLSQLHHLSLTNRQNLSIKTYSGVGRIGRIWGLTKFLFRNRLEGDIVHLHSTFAGLLYRAIRLLNCSRREKGRIIYQPHGAAHDPHRVPNAMLRRLYSLIEAALTIVTCRIVCISSYEASLFRSRLFGSKVRVVENGVRETLNLQSANPEYYLFIGRFDRQKGLDRLLDAWSTSWFENRKLLVVGTGVVSTGVKTRESPNIVFSNWVKADQVDALIARARAVIVPSRWECFGLVVPEALRNGIPIICSPRGALPSFVDDGRTGFTLDDLNFSNSLQQGIEFIESVDRKTWHSNCREAYLRRFTLDRMCKDIMKVYAEALREAG